MHIWIGVFLTGVTGNLKCRTKAQDIWIDSMLKIVNRARRSKARAEITYFIPFAFTLLGELANGYVEATGRFSIVVRMIGNSADAAF